MSILWWSMNFQEIHDHWYQMWVLASLTFQNFWLEKKKSTSISRRLDEIEIIELLKFYMVQTLSRRVTRKEFFTLPLISNGDDHDINKIKNSCKNNFKRMTTSSYVSELLTWIDILFLSPPLISFHLIFVSFDYPFSFLTKQILVLLSSCQPITQCQPANKPMSWNSFSQGTIWSTSSMEFHSFMSELLPCWRSTVEFSWRRWNPNRPVLFPQSNEAKFSLNSDQTDQAGDQAHCPLISTLKLWLNGACCIIHHPQVLCCGILTFQKHLTFKRASWTHSTQREPALAKRFQMCFIIAALFHSPTLFSPNPPSSFGRSG